MKYSKHKRLFAWVLALALVLGMFPAGLISVSAAVTDSITCTAELTFSDSGITETKAGNGYKIKETALTIKAAGVYRITGSCSEGSIEVAKDLSDVVLVLDNLTLACSTAAPVVVKKSSAVAIHLEGTSSLTDNEDPANETSTDTAIADAFEGACIKVKSGSTVTFCGTGNLNVVANAKNGIKGGSTAALVFNQAGTVTVSGSGKYKGGTTSGAAVNNGIACDGSIVINQGTFVIKAANDGIKSAPDATDEAEGTTIDNASLGTITINGGAFDIDVDGDGIQADTNLSIHNGIFAIKTLNGYNTKGTKYNTNNKTSSSYTFDPDTMSCKGLKASGDRAEEAGTEPVLYITGGTFTLDTADDAVHSDGYVTVTGGVFTIRTGDDGMHADTSLTLGTEGSTVQRDPDVTINASYEGLEGGTVYMYSGRYYVVASDDGVNAAGGTGSSSDPGPGGDHFKPGGMPGGFGGGPGGRLFSVSETGNEYNIFIYGGDLYVNCTGDGLDSNGGLYLYGGTQAVFSQSSGDNSAIDADGAILINGATIFTAGATGMDGSAWGGWFGNSQKYATSKTSYSKDQIVNAKAGNEVIISYQLPKAASYVMVSWPSSVSSSNPSIATATSVTACKGGSWSHNWNDGIVTTAATATTTGICTYICTVCGATETETIPITATIEACDQSGQDNENEEQSVGVSASIKDGLLKYQVSVPDGVTNAQLLIAWYDKETGQMKGCDVREANGGKLNVVANCTYKLFLVDQAFTPLALAAEP